jgi:hypothetical protein
MEIRKDQLLKELPKFWIPNNLSEFYTQRGWTILTENIDKEAIFNQNKHVKGTRNVFKRDSKDKRLKNALNQVIKSFYVNQQLPYFLSTLFSQNSSIKFVREGNTSQDDVYRDLFALYIIYLIKSNYLDTYKHLLDDVPKDQEIPFNRYYFLFLRAYLKDSIEKAVKDHFRRTYQQHHRIRNNSDDVYYYFTEIIDQFFLEIEKRYKLLVKLQIPEFPINPYELSISSEKQEELQKTINRTRKKYYKIQEQSLEDKGYQIFKNELEQVIYAEYGICKYSELKIFVSAPRKGIKEGLIYLNYSDSEINNLLSLKEVTKEYVEKNKKYFGKTDSSTTKYGPLDLITEYPERLNQLFQLVKNNENFKGYAYDNTDKLEKDLKSIVNAFRHYEQYIQTEKPPTIPETSKDEDGKEFSLIDFYIPPDDDMPTQEEEEKQNIGELEKRLGIKSENFEDIIDEARSQDENAKIGYRAIYINHFWIHINTKEKGLTETQLGNILQVKQYHIYRCIKRYFPKQIVEASFLKLRKQNTDLNLNIDKTEAINAIKLCIDDYIKGQVQRDLEGFCHNKSLCNPTIKPREILDYLNDKIKEDLPNANIYNESTIIQEYISQSKQ